MWGASGQNSKVNIILLMNEDIYQIISSNIREKSRRKDGWKLGKTRNDHLSRFDIESLERPLDFTRCIYKWRRKDHSPIEYPLDSSSNLDYCN